MYAKLFLINFLLLTSTLSIASDSYSDLSDLIDKHPDTPAVWGAMTGFVSQVHKPYKGKQYPAFETPLAAAIASKKYHIVDALITYRADVNKFQFGLNFQNGWDGAGNYDDIKCTPLMCAAQWSTPFIIRRLVIAGAKVEQRDACVGGYKALDYAKYNRTNRETVIAELEILATQPAGSLAQLRSAVKESTETPEERRRWDGLKSEWFKAVYCVARDQSTD